MIYIAIVILFVCFVLYIRVAKRLRIVDIPNHRSSHQQPTIRGAGIIFFISCLLFFVFFGFQYKYFILGLSLIAIVSFLDDLYTLSVKLRFPVQIASIFLMFYDADLLTVSWLMAIIGVILALGYLNIYNFMDGINGITGIYSLSILIPLLFVNNIIAIDFIDNNLLYLLIIAILFFGYLNFRKKAKVFAGDIGSISIGLAIIFIICKLIQDTHNVVYLSFGLVYALDGGLTIIERLFLHREDIFKPHRRHLYQLLVDRKKCSHIQTSLMYGLLQLLFAGIGIIAITNFTEQVQYVILALTMVSLIIFYFVLKRSMLLKKPDLIQ